MSWDIELIDPKTTKTVMLDKKHYLKGGSYLFDDEGKIRSIEYHKY